LEQKPENIAANTEQEEIAESFIPEENEMTGGNNIVLLFPLLLSIYLFLGFTNVDSPGKYLKKNAPEATTEKNEDGSPNINFSALLAPEEFSKNLRDTVYTGEDLWLELRIDQQTLYAHYRDGRVLKYPVSSGNPHASKSVESRPGLYAIFLKEEVHLSSQFNNARMNYFMPYNMGIGFHGLPGTGYYGHLGVRPSSHGCIRMRNEDVRVLFGQCKLGTLVLSHKGKSTRVVAFAPKDFKNDAEYTKDDYMSMLAYNLSSIMEGKYFLNPPKKFVLDGTIIPRSGINVVSTDNIPEKQMLPFTVVKIKQPPDKLVTVNDAADIKELEAAGYNDMFQFSNTDTITTAGVDLPIDPETVKKYSHNPVGILPYFPPNR
jgi:hypothetical protein